MLHGLRVDDFSIYQHQLIFDAMCKSVHKQPKTMSAYEGITKKAVETFKPAVVTGWPVLDAHVKLSPGRLAVLGARPGMGKTTLATQLSAQVLKHNREIVMNDTIGFAARMETRKA